MKRRVLGTLGGILLLCSAMSAPARAQEATAPNPEIERLKTQLAAQQEQIDQLRRVLDDQKKVLDQAGQKKEDQQKTAEETSQPKPPSLGQVASTASVIPAGDVAPVLHPGLAAAVTPMQVPPDEAPAPLQLKIGSATITPLGFMDFTGVFRTADGGSSIGTNFGSTPYNNVSTGLGKLSEFRFSAQNSRIGARIDANVHGTKVLAYWESDFLGTQSTNAGVSSQQRQLPHPRLFRGPDEGQVGDPRWPIVEHADAGTHGHLAAAGRPLLHPGHGHELPSGPVLDPSSAVPRRLSRQPDRDFGSVARDRRPVRRRIVGRRRGRAAERVRDTVRQHADRSGRGHLSLPQPASGHPGQSGFRSQGERQPDARRICGFSQFV